MSKCVYLTTTEPFAGKIAIVLGMMSHLERNMRRVGYFRPIARTREGEGVDPNIQLVSEIYGLEDPIESMYGVTTERVEKMITSKQYDYLLEEILERFKAYEAKCDFVLIEGTNYEGATSAFEFDLNADIARNLGSPIILIASGRNKTPEEILSTVMISKETFDELGSDYLSTIVNRVSRKKLDETKDLLSSKFGAAEIDFAGAIPEDEILANPRMDDIVEALGAKVHYGERYLDNLVHDFRIAAMSLSPILDRLGQGSLIITSGDRVDILLGIVAAQLSRRMPYVAGILLASGMEPSSEVDRLLEGISGMRLPVISVKTGLFQTSMDVSKVGSRIRPSSARKIENAQILFEENVDIERLTRRFRRVRPARKTPKLFLHDILMKARANRRTIVLPEGKVERILRAADSLMRRNIVDIVLLGNEDEVRAAIDSLKLNMQDVAIIDPLKAEKHEAYARAYHEAREHKGITMEHARDVMEDNTYFGTMMVQMGDAHGMVSGSIHTTAHTLRPAFEFIKTKPGVSIVSSVFFMCLSDRVLVYGDCAVNPNPTAEQLAEIAVTSADTAATFGIEPKVAMLSYSTGASGKGDDVEAVIKATEIARKQRPDLLIEGPLQYDAAVDMGVARTKLPESSVAGQATVFIFPDLNTGNNTYKAVQRSAKAIAVGPVLQGLNKPVNDLSRGCTIPDIVNTVAITAIQALNGS
ncbi:MAG: phosphate acetyltransferase [Planctomycetota bacterium]|jgi:phosphate acetyltransferase